MLEEDIGEGYRDISVGKSFYFSSSVISFLKEKNKQENMNRSKHTGILKFYVEHKEEEMVVI